MAREPRKREYDVDMGFPQARYLVVHSYENASQLATDSGMGRDTCYDLFNPAVEDKRFTPKIQQTVMALYEGYPMLGDQLRRILAPGDNEYARIADYAGRYTYYRYSPTGKFVAGAMIVEPRRNVWIAKHYNLHFKQHNFKEALPDHQGVVYVAGERVYIVGIGQHYFRPIVAHTVKSVARDYLRGAVMGVHESGALFAASFVMVHETHPEFSEPHEEHYRRLIGDSNLQPGILVP